MPNLRKFSHRWLKTAIVILISVLAVFMIVRAAPPGSPYTPGETLNPSCSPGDANCTVTTSGWVNSGTYVYPSSTTWFVGIGTTTPATPLDVNGSSTIRNNLRLTNLAGATGCLSVDAEGDISTSTCSSATFTTTTITVAGTTLSNTAYTFATSGITGLSISGTGSTLTWTIATSSATTNGFLTSSDWSTFNSKQSSITLSTSTFRTATAMNISSSSGTWTLNYPAFINDLAAISTSTGNLLVASSTGWKGLTVGNNGKVLMASSTASLGVSWETVSAGGSNTQLQFNNGGAFAGDANLTWSSSTQLLTLTGTSTISGHLSIGTTTISSTLFNIATSTNIFSVLSSGRVGIGTSTPMAALHIGNTSSSYITSPSNALMVSGELEVGGSAYLGPMEFSADSGVISWIDMPVSTSTATSTVESYSARLGGTNILTIYGLAAGGAGGITNPAVGIGTTTPSHALTINGSLFVSTSTIPTLFVASSTGRVGVGTSTPATLFTVATTTNIFNVLSNGNIGIGTTTPAYKLQIAGAIVPTSDNLWSLGTSGLRWSNIFAASSTVGDLIFGNEFRITEDYETPRALIFRNQNGDEIMRLDENGNLIIPGSISSASSSLVSEENSNGFGLIGNLIDSVKSALNSLGLIIENGVMRIKELITDTLFAKKARIEKLEMVDSATGEIYCTWIENGEWQKIKGECGETQESTSNNQQPTEELPTEQTPSEQPLVEDQNQENATSTPPIEQATPTFENVISTTEEPPADEQPPNEEQNNKNTTSTQEVVALEQVTSTEEIIEQPIE